VTFRQYGLVAVGLLTAAFLVGFLAGPRQDQSASQAATEDLAPPLSVTEWVKGGSIDIAAGKGRNVYIIEFWATWCMPCRVSSPHLSDLQRKYADRGLIVVGITDEDADVVKVSVEKAGADMDYAVAIDDTRTTLDAYMTARGMKGFPSAFLVNREGNIVWRGHPMKGLDEALTGCGCGGDATFDRGKGAGATWGRRTRCFRASSCDRVGSHDRLRRGSPQEGLIRKSLSLSAFRFTRAGSLVGYTSIG